MLVFVPDWLPTHMLYRYTWMFIHVYAHTCIYTYLYVPSIYPCIYKYCVCMCVHHLEFSQLIIDLILSIIWRFTIVISLPKGMYSTHYIRSIIVTHHFPIWYCISISSRYFCHHNESKVEIYSTDKTVRIATLCIKKIPLLFILN